jgi:hypothetical protein
MATTTAAWRQAFHGPGTQVQVACDDGVCLLDVCVDLAGVTSCDAVDLEVLVQPRDGLGLPSGPVVELLRQRIALRPTPDGRRITGHIWLPPSLGPGILPQCYLRVTRVTA